MRPSARETHKALVTMLNDATGKQFGRGKIPDDTTLPYGIVYYTGSGYADGSWADPQEDRTLSFQVTCVGANDEQVQWLQEAADTAITGRGSDGAYTYDLAVTGFNIQNRSCDGLGATLPSGNDLRQSADTYRIRAGA